MKNGYSSITARRQWQFAGLLAITLALSACSSNAARQTSGEATSDEPVLISATDMSIESQAEIEIRRECRKKMRRTGSRIARDACGGDSGIFATGFDMRREDNSDSSSEPSDPQR